VLFGKRLTNLGKGGFNNKVNSVNFEVDLELNNGHCIK
jgi:hypothetical protein